ncbi:MAG: hypothetical protein GEU95_24905 [Rhizobiales bacterium]|nr:hypothetical protein [Hyphomicrobiales bacterium]
MPDVVSDDELNALAAEYVLGTLDYEERKGAAALIEVDAAFRGIVRIWERRFGDLHLMVEAVEPDPQLWERIKPKVPSIEQVPLAIPSHADEQARAAAAAPAEAPAGEAARPATSTAAATPPPTEAPAAAAATPAADTTAAQPKTEATVADGTVPAVAAAETPPGESKPDESKPDESKPDESKPDESKPDESKPADAVPPAIAETERKLAELTALLPAAEQSEAGKTEPLSEDGLHTHAPDLVPRGFVPPVPMGTRGTPTVVEVPVRETGRGWMAATVMMGLVSLVLAGLIGAWRYFPERLPAPLRAHSVLNLPAPQASPAKARPKIAPFDE